MGKMPEFGDEMDRERMELEGNQEVKKGRRKRRPLLLMLTPAAAKEMERLRGVTGLSFSQIFRFGFSLFRIYVGSKQEGRIVCVADRDGRVIYSIELPFELCE